jgi:hypothetical protein
VSDLVVLHYTLRSAADFCVGFEVLTAVAVGSSVFWDTTPCSPVKIMSKPSKKPACCLRYAGFLLILVFGPEGGGDMLLRNVC